MNMDTRNMAVFCDFENVALGVRDLHTEAFDIDHAADVPGARELVGVLQEVDQDLAEQPGIRLARG